MKTLFRILGVLAILIALLTCSLSISRAEDDKKDVAESQIQMADAKQQLATLKEQAKLMTGESKTEMDAQIATIEEGLADVPSESTYLIVQILLGGLLLIALAFGFFLFRPSLKLTTQLLGAAVLFMLAAYFLSPDIKRGNYGGLESKTLALVSGVPVIIAGLLAFLVARKSIGSNK